MQKLLSLTILLIATAAHAGQPVITETDDAIVVEYTGAVADAGTTGAKSPATSPAAKPVTAVNPGKQARSRFLAAQIQQLRREAEEALKLTGNESDDELARKASLSAEKRSKADLYADEYRQITGSEPEIVERSGTAAAESTQSQFMAKKIDREERIRRTKELRGSRMTEQSQ